MELSCKVGFSPVFLTIAFNLIRHVEQNELVTGP